MRLCTLCLTYTHWRGRDAQKDNQHKYSMLWICMHMHIKPGNPHACTRFFHYDCPLLPLTCFSHINPQTHSATHLWTKWLSPPPCWHNKHRVQNFQAYAGYTHAHTRKFCRQLRCPYPSPRPRAKPSIQRGNKCRSMCVMNKLHALIRAGSSDKCLSFTH